MDGNVWKCIKKLKDFLGEKVWKIKLKLDGKKRKK